MEEILLLSMGQRIVVAVVAVIVWWWVLRLLAKSVKRNARDDINKMAEDPVAIAIYYSARLLGVAYIVGCALG